MFLKIQEDIDFHLIITCWNVTASLGDTTQYSTLISRVFFKYLAGIGWIHQYFKTIDLDYAELTWTSDRELDFKNTQALLLYENLSFILCKGRR